MTYDEKCVCVCVCVCVYPPCIKVCMASFLRMMCKEG